MNFSHAMRNWNLPATILQVSIVHTPVVQGIHYMFHSHRNNLYYISQVSLTKFKNIICQSIKFTSIKYDKIKVVLFIYKQYLL
jgi:hypothetical protein